MGSMLARIPKATLVVSGMITEERQTDLGRTDQPCEVAVGYDAPVGTLVHASGLKWELPLGVIWHHLPEQTLCVAMTAPVLTSSLTCFP
jgi:hypothetical protein